MRKNIFSIISCIIVKSSIIQKEYNQRTDKRTKKENSGFMCENIINNVTKNFEKYHNFNYMEGSINNVEFQNHQEVFNEQLKSYGYIDKQYEYYPNIFNEYKRMKDELIYDWEEYAWLMKILNYPDKSNWNWVLIKDKKHHKYSDFKNNYKILNNYSYKDLYILQNQKTNKVIAIHKDAIIKEPFVHGDRCIILQKSTIYSNNEIGDDVLIGENCIISSGCIIKSNNIFHRNIKIKDNVYIDSNNIFMENTSIGANKNYDFPINPSNNTIEQKTTDSFNRKALINDLFQILEKNSFNVFIGKGNFFGKKTRVFKHCFFSDYNFLGYRSIVCELSFFLSRNIFFYFNYVYGNVIVFNNFKFEEYQDIGEFEYFFYENISFNKSSEFPNFDRNQNLYIIKEKRSKYIGTIQGLYLRLDFKYIIELFEARLGII